MPMSTSDEGHPSGDLVRCLSYYSQLKPITFKKWGHPNLVSYETKYLWISINILIFKNPQVNQCENVAKSIERQTSGVPREASIFA
jgi:hypothetical protein